MFTNNKELSLADLGAIAYLLCRGFRHAELRPTGQNGRYAFIYTDEKAREATTDYYTGATVPARQFADCMRVVKSMLYDCKPVYRKDQAECLAGKGGTR